MTSAAYSAAQTAARDAYGKLIATLCRQGHDVARAEDALCTAFERALTHWPTAGVPATPAAWLLTTARRLLIDAARHRQVERDGATVLLPLLEAGPSIATEPDRRVELMLTCAHPAIDVKARAPLMLQTVLGLTAQQMSTAFQVSPAALGQRLARAKRHIRDQGLPFGAPDNDERSARLADVLSAIYAAFGTGWEDVEGAQDRRHGLADEALWLGRIVCAQEPRHAQAHGLVALMLFSAGRVHARRDSAGGFVPLLEQDRALWDWSMMDAAEQHLARAASLNAMGRYQLEAAIQSQHVRTSVGEPPNVEAIALLYEGLVRVAPTLAALVGRAAALGEARGAAAGLGALASLPRNAIKTYQPYFAVKAHLHLQAGQPEPARDAYTRAIGLSEDPAVRAFLAGKLKRIDDA